MKGNISVSKIIVFLLEYLYHRYRHSDIFKFFMKKLTWTSVHWKFNRIIAFVLRLPETSVFPRKHEHIRAFICFVGWVLFEGDNGEEFTLVSWIVTYIFWGYKKLLWRLQFWFFKFGQWNTFTNIKT